MPADPGICRQRPLLHRVLQLFVLNMTTSHACILWAPLDSSLLGILFLSRSNVRMNPRRAEKVPLITPPWCISSSQRNPSPPCRDWYQPQICLQLQAKGCGEIASAKQLPSCCDGIIGHLCPNSDERPWFGTRITAEGLSKAAFICKLLKMATSTAFTLHISAQYSLIEALPHRLSCQLLQVMKLNCGDLYSVELTRRHKLLPSAALRGQLPSFCVARPRSQSSL